MTGRLALAALLSLATFHAHAAVVYSQPPDGSGSLYQSAVNGTDYDQMTWDSFRLTNAAAITELHWRGGFVHGGGYGGPATNWTIAIYGDIANGYQPDIINPPLVTYAVAGNAGQTNAGTFGGTAMYDYAFTLPSPFQASSNQFYWVLIQANQTGLPEWGIALGSGGNGKCFRRIANVGDWWYYLALGDTAFTLVASDSPTVNIAASASPAGMGTIIGAGDYPLGASVSLRATPATGYGFVKWTQNGAQVSTAATYNFTAATNRVLVANFVPAYAVAVSASPGYAGPVTGAGTYNSNTTVTVTAADASGFQFVSWTEFGTTASTLRSYTFPATANRALVANYAFRPQTAVFDFDTGTPTVYPGWSMPGSQSNRNETAYFTALAYSWSVQNSIYGWVSPLFSGNFLYPSTWGSTLKIQFSPPVTNFSTKFVTADLTVAGDVPTIVRATAYTNSTATTPVGSATAQGSKWVNGPYPDGTLTFSSATPFDIVTLDFPPGQVATISYLLFVDNIVVQRQIAAPANVTVATTAFPSYAGTTTGDGTFAAATVVPVTASPNAGFAFVNWVEAGALVSTSSNYTFTATNSRTLFANFTPLYSISALAGSGGSATGSGAFTNGAAVTLSATPSNGFYFVNWTEAGVPASPTASYSFTASADRALVANFASGWTISTSSSPGAGGTTSGGGGYTNGATAIVMATPNANYAFAAWKQGSAVVSTAPSYAFTVTTNRALTATFIRTYMITTLALPAFGGGVNGAGTYTNGASVTVRALTSPGFVFTNWTDGAAVVANTTNFTFTVSSNRTLTANFSSSTPSSTILANTWPDFAGTVSGAGVYTNGTTATLTASPNPHFAFSQWTENGLPVSAAPNYSFTVLSNRTLLANFTDTNPPPVAVGGTFYQLAGQPLVINLADLTFYDYDADGDPLTLIGISHTTTNGLTITTNATQILVPGNSVPDGFSYTVTDGNGGKATGTATIAIITSPASQVLSLDPSIPGGVWVGFTGVPWYYYTAQRATNTLFAGTVQTWAVQAFSDGSIYLWDDFADIGGQPDQAFYRLISNP